MMSCHSRSLVKSFYYKLNNYWYSEIIYVPGSTNCCISPVTRVSLVLSGTRNARALPVPLSTMPKTQVPLPIRPRLYLRLWPNIDSSISTVFPRPPSLMFPCRILNCENGVATMDQGKYLEVVHDEMCLFTLLTTFIKPLVGSKWTNEKFLTVMEKYSYVK